MTAAPLLALLLAAAPSQGAPAAGAAAVAQPAAGQPAAQAPQPAAPGQGPDIELHVPRAEVKKVSLDVENLQARLDVDTRVANLVQISAGVVATVGRMKVELDEVAAETHLVVRLDRVVEVMSRALATLDQHPDLAGGPAGAPPARAGIATVAAGAATDAGSPAAPAAPVGNLTGVKP